MDLTAIVTCKNRDNLRFCISSMRACYPRPYCIVVDFGSDPPIDFSGYKSWLKVIRVTRNTDMFHKARAINIGIKAVVTKYLCITDADQIFSPDFFGHVRKALHAGTNNFVMCKTYSLLEVQPYVDFDNKGKIFNTFLEKAKCSGVPLHGDGCCNGVATAWAVKVHGYDEDYVGHRAQDSDFALRAIASGLRKVWIEGYTSMVHLAHMRVGEYYSENYRVPNKKKYKRKTKLNPRKIVVANPNGIWGKL